MKQPVTFLKGGQFIRFAMGLWVLLLLASPVHADLTGPAIVEQHCAACHASGVANAPRIGVTDDWAELLAMRDLETIVDNAYDGLGRMPARGFCTACDRNDIAQAVDAMLPEELAGPDL